ncbi:MAG: hypothetical protein KGJ13_06820 [Patescibacteria group bacterium]|nr:hypothetical protein [Patescibacteria group bacterium]
MGWKNIADWKAWQKRRVKRGMQQGLVLENEVEQILGSMQETGIISSFTHHHKWSYSDRNGKDFRVKEKSVCFFQENVHFGFSLVKWERMIETSIFFCEI